MLIDKKSILKALKTGLYGHWICLLFYLIYDCALTRFMLIVTAISIALILIYGFYMIFKYNPNLEREDKEEE
jgi:hypothetical protein